MHHDTTTLVHYVPDLAKDKFHVWITKYHYVPMIVLGLALLAAGGLPWLLWGHLPPHRCWPARHVAGQLGHPPVGLTSFCHA
jgi:fatty-acid desaturase